MNYLLLLGLHMTAVSLWLVSMLATSIAVAAFSEIKPTPGVAKAIAGLRIWDRFVTMPAMAVTWLLGITLVIEGGWFGSPWLTVKLIFVVILSGIHGLLAKSLRRLQNDAQARISAAIKVLPIVILIGVVVIVWLATTKPF